MLPKRKSSCHWYHYVNFAITTDRKFSMPCVVGVYKSSRQVHSSVPPTIAGVELKSGHHTIFRIYPFSTFNFCPLKICAPVKGQVNSLSIDSHSQFINLKMSQLTEIHRWNSATPQFWKQSIENWLCLDFVLPGYQPVLICWATSMHYNVETNCSNSKKIANSLFWLFLTVQCAWNCATMKWENIVQ